MTRSLQHGKAKGGAGSPSTPPIPRAYWRSLEDATRSPELIAAVEKKFPGIMGGLDPVDRREFLRLMGASLAFAGLTACTRQPTEKIIPYVTPPEELIPGKPLFFATAMTLGGYAYGLLAESHMGRPTKVEGNPDHPASLGATDAFAQASILDLYDPDRSQAVFNRGRVSTWDAFVVELQKELSFQQAVNGEGLRLLTETVTSPTLAAQIEALLKKYPSAKWHQYEPVNRDMVHEGSLLAFGRRVDTHYLFAEADIVVSLGADFLSWGPGHVRYARDFSSRRNLVDGKGMMNRLYVVESTPSVTGAAADHVLALPPSAIERFARALAKEVGVDTVADEAGIPREWIEAVSSDLKRNHGRSIVVPGENQPAVVHALAHAINDRLKNHGRTVQLIEPVEAAPVNQGQSLAELAADMQAGKVELLVMIDGNPVYTAPADLKFEEALRKVKFRVRHGHYEDETSAVCQWHIPATHYLEAWSDARAYDGTVTIQQPLVAPLYAGKSSHELLDALVSELPRSGYEVVQEYWKARLGEAAFEPAWRKAVHDGLVADSASPGIKATVSGSFSGELSPPVPAGHLEVSCLPDASAWDGRFVNNSWLMETPRPLSKLVWDNALYLSPATAREQHLSNGDMVVVVAGELTTQAPVWILPGHADECGSLQLGYGQALSGRIGRKVGHNAYAVRSATTPWTFAATLYKTGRSHQLVSTQDHPSVEGRDSLRTGTFEEYTHHPDFVHHHGKEHNDPPSIYPAHPYDQSPQWGMVIDLSRCIGCNACMLACQSENNIPIVGKKQVANGRELHWIRIDRYYQGDAANPDVAMQPITCMHCETAPCEAVCPVGATVHSRDGLNQMVYNRCVGTRYCSNNCPYKVRRFNFFKYTDDKSPSLALQRNPDVTVRSRGVMEKCTYCVQRISEARIEAKKQNRPIRDGEVVTACQQVCPARAISFGDISDAQAEISRHRASPLNYNVLGVLGTKPRTTYLARVRNPNPALSPHEEG